MPSSRSRGAFALALLAFASARPGCRKPRPAHLVGLALDVGGRGDQSFNDGALRGLEAMAAGLKYTAQGYQPLSDVEYQALLPADLRAVPGGVPHLALPAPLVLSGKAQEDYEPNLQLLVDQGAELVVAVGFMMEPATRAVAARNPNAKFLLLDSPVLDETGRQPTTRPNVRAVVFREQEGSFLAGALAGELTRTGKVGVVGGMQLPLIKKFEAGLYAGGCDIVFHAAGLDGLGLIKAAQAAGKLVIGVDSDQAHVAPRNVLTSMVKHLGLAVYEAARDMLAGKFVGGDVVLGLKDGGVGLSPLGGGADPAIPN